MNMFGELFKNEKSRNALYLLGAGMLVNALRFDVQSELVNTIGNVVITLISLLIIALSVLMFKEYMNEK